MFDRSASPTHDESAGPPTERRDALVEVEDPTEDHEPLEPRTADDLADDGNISSTLPVPADVAYEAFCDLPSSPLWVSVVKSVKVVERDPAGRAIRAAYLARLRQASIGYTLAYRYDPDRRAVSWSTAPGSATIVRGRAEFTPLGDRACLVQYQLSLELPSHALPDWEDPYFSGHAASVVMNDFRDYVTRMRRH